MKRAAAQRSLRCVAYCNLDLCSLRARRKGSRVYALPLEQCVRAGCSSFALSHPREAPTGFVLSQLAGLTFDGPVILLFACFRLHCHGRSVSIQRRWGFVVSFNFFLVFGRLVLHETFNTKMLSCVCFCILHLMTSTCTAVRAMCWVSGFGGSLQSRFCVTIVSAFQCHSACVRIVLRNRSTNPTCRNLSSLPLWQLRMREVCGAQQLTDHRAIAAIKLVRLPTSQVIDVSRFVLLVCLE